MLYPKVDHSFVTAFTIILKNVQEESTYLSSDECPYSSELKRLLWVLKPGKVASTATPGELTDEDLLDHAERLLFEFDEVKDQFDGNTVTSEKISYLRAKTSLLEKIIEQRNLVQASINSEKFKRLILDMMDDIMTDDQRALLLEKMKKAIAQS